MTTHESILVDRRTGEELIYDEPSGGVVSFLYGSPVGRAIMACPPIPWLASTIWGACMRSPLSTNRISPFVEDNGVDMEGCPPVDSYGSFAEFFSRPRDVTPCHEEDRATRLLSVVDSRLLAVPMGGGTEFQVEAKGTRYTLPALMGADRRHSENPMRTGRCMAGVVAETVQELRDGTCLVFRLSLSDWHRFLYPFDGRLVDCWDIPGQLHSVRRIADGARPYSMNKRCVSILEASGFTQSLPALMVEIGALLVGHIKQNHEPPHCFLAGQEKGRFELGGSTVVLFVSPQVRIDDDIIRNSNSGKETLVRAGEPIGRLPLTCRMPDGSEGAHGEDNEGGE